MYFSGGGSCLKYNVNMYPLSQRASHWNPSPSFLYVMYLFDSCDDEYHVCGVDNLYMSTKICRDTFNHSKKIKLHGVTRKSGRGLPDCFLQEELHNKAHQEKVRGTNCAAELVGDSDCPSLIVVSVYDTKPVHFLPCNHFTYQRPP